MFLISCDLVFEGVGLDGVCVASGLCWFLR